MMMPMTSHKKANMRSMPESESCHLFFIGPFATKPVHMTLYAKHCSMQESTAFKVCNFDEGRWAGNKCCHREPKE